MGKLIIDLSTIQTISATQSDPVELRIISQIDDYDQTTGHLTLMNLVPQPTVSKLKRKRSTKKSSLSHSSKPRNDLKSKSKDVAGPTGTGAEAKNRSSTSSTVSGNLVSQEPISTTPPLAYTKTISVNINGILPTMNISTTLLHQGTVVNVEVLYYGSGTDESLTAIDLYEVKEPGTVISRLDELLAYEKV